MVTRARILDAARNVFHRRGITRSSLADVATEAGVTRGAIYWHFKNKTDLFEALLHEVRLPMESFITPETRLPESNSDPLSQIREWCRFAICDIVENASSRKVLETILFKCEMVDADDGIALRRLECFHAVKAKLIMAIQRAVDKQQLPHDLNVPLAAATLNATVYGMISNWLFSPGGFELNRYVDSVVDHCIFGLQHSPSLRDAPQPLLNQ